WLVPAARGTHDHPRAATRAPCPARCCFRGGSQPTPTGGRAHAPCCDARRCDHAPAERGAPIAGYPCVVAFLRCVCVLSAFFATTHVMHVLSAFFATTHVMHAATLLSFTPALAHIAPVVLLAFILTTLGTTLFLLLTRPRGPNAHTLTSPASSRMSLPVEKPPKPTLPSSPPPRYALALLLSAQLAYTASAASCVALSFSPRTDAGLIPSLLTTRAPLPPLLVLRILDTVFTALALVSVLAAYYVRVRNRAPTAPPTTHHPVLLPTLRPAPSAPRHALKRRPSASSSFFSPRPKRLPLPPGPEEEEEEYDDDPSKQDSETHASPTSTTACLPRVSPSSSSSSAHEAQEGDCTDLRDPFAPLPPMPPPPPYAYRARWAPDLGRMNSCAYSCSYSWEEGQGHGEGTPMPMIPRAPLALPPVHALRIEKRASSSRAGKERRSRRGGALRIDTSTSTGTHGAGDDESPIPTPTPQTPTPAMTTTTRVWSNTYPRPPFNPPPHPHPSPTPTTPNTSEGIRTGSGNISIGIGGGREDALLAQRLLGELQCREGEGAGVRGV
ncbi:hypothetical protein H0H87_002051, partial [Tephrocybe sp. NHM501043]